MSMLMGCGVKLVKKVEPAYSYTAYRTETIQEKYHIYSTKLNGTISCSISAKHIKSGIRKTFTNSAVVNEVRQKEGVYADIQRVYDRWFEEPLSSSVIYK